MAKHREAIVRTRHDEEGYWIASEQGSTGGSRNRFEFFALRDEAKGLGFVPGEYAIERIGAPASGDGSIWRLMEVR